MMARANMAPADPPTLQADDCYRCGYALHGIADDQPCPECGLLARRSRRVTDDLHRTRPHWLRRIAFGTALILLGVVLMGTFPLIASQLAEVLQTWRPLRISPTWRPLLPLLTVSPMSIATLMLLAGTWLLTSREGYAPADQADRWRRGALRALAAHATVGIISVNVETHVNSNGIVIGSGANAALAVLQVICAISIIPFPLLLFAHLRSLARRVRSAHLAEHCAIVGAGMSATLLVFFATGTVTSHAQRLGLSRDWISRSAIGLGLVVGLIVMMALFAIWSVYLLVRFAIAFRRAARARRREWQGDDRSVAPPTPAQTAT